jgi:hypothetical protein
VKRFFGVLGAVLLLGSTIAVPASAADPCPPITTELNISDPFLGSGLEYDAKKKTITFITEDGERLVGKNARKIGKRRVIITSRTPELTIDVRADLLRGQVMASATERDVDPDMPNMQGQPRIRHTLYVPNGPPMPKCRAAVPVKPAPKAAPTKAATTFDPKKYLGQGDKYNCDSFANQAQAQAVLRADPKDPNKLDQGGVPGVACDVHKYVDKTRDDKPVKVS